jgi:hypothetical protein
MSEERMIRVAMEDEDIVLGFLTIADKWGHTRVVDIELEPVAPKDWKPACYDKDEDGDCKAEWFSYATLVSQCEDCPYRKKRE